MAVKVPPFTTVIRPTGGLGLMAPFEAVPVAMALFDTRLPDSRCCSFGRQDGTSVHAVVLVMTVVARNWTPVCDCSDCCHYRGRGDTVTTFMAIPVIMITPVTRFGGNDRFDYSGMCRLILMMIMMVIVVMIVVVMIVVIIIVIVLFN